MDLTISSRASLSAALLDPVTGLGGSVPVGLNFGGRAEIAGAGVVSLSWAPETGKSFSLRLTESLEITTTAVTGPVLETLQAYAGDPAWVQDADQVEFVLVADPLAVDGFGNPVAASRASDITIQGMDADDGVQFTAVLAVTAAGQAAIFRRASGLTGTRHITYLAVSGVTATPCKLYITFGGQSGT